MIKACILKKWRNHVDKGRRPSTVSSSSLGDDCNKENAVFKIGPEVTVSRLPMRTWPARGESMRKGRPSVVLPRRPYVQQRTIIRAPRGRLIINPLNEEARRQREDAKLKLDFTLCETKDQFAITERVIMREMRELKLKGAKNSVLKYPSMEVYSKAAAKASSKNEKEKNSLEMPLLNDEQSLMKLGLILHDGPELEDTVKEVAKKFVEIHRKFSALWEIGTKFDLDPKTSDVIFSSIQRFVISQMKTLICVEEMKRAISLLNMWYLHAVEDLLRIKTLSTATLWYVKLFTYMEYGVGCKFYCDFCPLVFVEQQLYEVHRRQHVASILFKCERCCLGFEMNDAFEEHMINYHDGNISNRSVKSGRSATDRPTTVNVRSNGSLSRFGRAVSVRTDRSTGLVCPNPSISSNASVRSVDTDRRTGSGRTNSSVRPMESDHNSDNERYIDSDATIDSDDSILNDSIPGSDDGEIVTAQEPEHNEPEQNEPEKNEPQKNEPEKNESTTINWSCVLCHQVFATIEEAQHHLTYTHILA